MRTLLSRALPALALLALAGCGAERPAVALRDAEPGERTKRVEYARAGIAAEIPARADPRWRRAPGVFRFALADAVIAAYAYRRDEVLPKGGDQLEDARRRLLAEVKKRSEDFEVDRVTKAEVAGAPALEVTGEQTLSRARIRTRSVHVYKGRAEYVFELLSPRSRYERIERYAFDPMLDSLELTGRVRKPAKKGG